MRIIIANIDCRSYLIDTFIYSSVYIHVVDMIIVYYTVLYSAYFIITSSKYCPIDSNFSANFIR